MRTLETEEERNLRDAITHAIEDAVDFALEKMEVLTGKASGMGAVLNYVREGNKLDIVVVFREKQK